jgi:glycosyltransferase involved in cell wall biosynthesis
MEYVFSYVVAEYSILISMKLSIVIPVYNEEKLITTTIEKVVNAPLSQGMQRELVIVDDGSTDNTVKNVKFLMTNDKWKLRGTTLLFIQKKKNEGKGAALKDAFSKTTGDIVLIQDADLEYSPDDYPILLEAFVTQQADVVYGSRFISHRPHRVLYFWHSIMNKFLTMFSNMFSNLNLTDMETGFKVFRGDLIRKIAPNLKTQLFGFEPEITARIARIPEIKIYEVGISYAGRTYKDGKKIGWVDGVKAIWEIVYFNLLVK